MDLPTDLRYTAEHAYVRPSPETNVFRTGITDFAQSELGDIVYLNLPNVGDAVTAGLPYGSIEAVKTVSELYSPLTGIVSAINPRLPDEAALVNTEPFDGGWIIEIKVTPPLDTTALIDAAAYTAITGG